MKDIWGGPSTMNGLLVVGFFTPDYHIRALSLSNSLTELRHEHLLYAVNAGLTWGDIIMLKPTIVLQAMKDFPGRTIVFMDVDSSIRGPMFSAAEFNGDVRLHIKARPIKRGHFKVYGSARVMVFKPTEGARSFLLEWQKACANPYRGWFSRMSCEREMTRALGSQHIAAIAQLPLKYAGREVIKAHPDDVIVHTSAYQEDRRRSWGWLGSLKIPKRAV